MPGPFDVPDQQADSPDVPTDIEVVEMALESSRQRRMLLLDREVSVALAPRVDGCPRPPESRHARVGCHVPFAPAASRPQDREAQEIEYAGTFASSLVRRRSPKIRHQFD